MALKFLLDFNDPRFLDGRLFFGGGGGSSAPAAPDPEATAAAQAKYGKETAIWNSALNNVNQITPFGSLTWSLGGHSPTGGQGQTQTQTNTSGMQQQTPSGSYNSAQAAALEARRMMNPQGFGPDMQAQLNSYNGTGGVPSGTQSQSQSSTGGGSNDPFGASGLPQWTSQVNLSPESQAIFDSYMRQQNQLGGLSESALNQVGQAYASPYNYDSLQSVYGADDLNAARSRTEEAIYSRLNPQFQQDEEALRTRLINQGIGQGSQAYSREMENFNQMKNDARMQAVLAGGTESDRALAQSLSLRQQGIGEIDKLRAQPLNEYLAMSGQQQLAMPQFQQYNYAGAGTPDYQGLVNQQYQSQMNQYNANQASSNNLMGGLFGLGGMAAGGFLGSSAGSNWLSGILS